MKTKIISKILLSLGLAFVLGSAITQAHGGSPKSSAYSSNHGHPRQVAIQSFSWGATQSGSFAAGGGDGAGKPKIKTGNVTDRNLKGAGAGKAVGKPAEAGKPMTCRKAGKFQQEFLR